MKNNLERIYDVWTNLDSRKPAHQNAAEFLRTLVANGDKDKVSALLAKAANDIETAEDNKKYAVLQSAMLAVLNMYDDIPAEISSLEAFIEKALAGNVKAARISLESFMYNLNPGKAYRLPSVDFKDSPVGIELITADSVHKVTLLSETAVIIPRWVSSLDLLGYPENEFHKKAFLQFSAIDKDVLPLVVINKGDETGDKIIPKRRLNTTLTCGDVEIAVMRI